MELIISGRHDVEIDQTIRGYIEERVGKLAEEYPKLTSARIVLEYERHWHLVEAHINGKQVTLEAKAKSRDFMVSTDTVVEKLERQLRKHLERMQNHHRPMKNGGVNGRFAEEVEDANAE